MGGDGTIHLWGVLMELDEYRSKPIEEVRVRVMDLLATYYARGALELEEYESRAATAAGVQTRGELEALLGGLPALAAPERSPAAERRADLPVSGEREFSINSGEVRQNQTLVSIFSGVSRRGKWYPARTTQVVAFFGGAEIDLREAHIPEGVSTITVLCAFGGATIIVPPGVNVEVNGVGIFGAFDSRVPEGPRVNGPTIRVDGLCFFGGAEVKLKPLKRG